MATKKVVHKPGMIAKLKRDNRTLRSMCIVALDRLQNMTTEQFLLGADKPLREMLAEVIEKTK